MAKWIVVRLKDSRPSNFFGVNRNNDQAPAGKGGGSEVWLEWKTDSLLDVQHHHRAGIIRAESKPNGVVIKYGTYY